MGTEDSAKAFEQASTLVGHESTGSGQSQASQDRQTFARPEAGAPSLLEVASPLLEVKNLTKSFGGVIAVNNASFDIYPGEILALIGPNGAGKTTIFNLISGTHRPDGGSVTLEGHSLSGMRPSRVAALGVVRTFQNLQIFDNMTVLENVMVGCHLQGKSGFLAAAVRWPGTAAEDEALRAQAKAYLDMVGLADQAHVKATSLPFGQQRMVEFARALAVRPRLLLLDEPAAGLTRVEAEALDELICRIRDEGITVFLVEHDMNLVMGIADRIIVLHYGTKIAEGSPNEVQSNPEVIAAYLGTDWQGPASGAVLANDADVAKRERAGA